MTIAEMSIRELSLAKADELEKNDIILIRDKKRKKDKGIFVSKRYAASIEKFLEKQKKKEKQKKIDGFMQFAGMIKGGFSHLGEKAHQEIKENMKV